MRYPCTNIFSAASQHTWHGLQHKNETIGVLGSSPDPLERRGTQPVQLGWLRGGFIACLVEVNVGQEESPSESDHLGR